MHDENAKRNIFMTFLTAERSSRRPCTGTGGVHGVKGAQSLDLLGRREVGREHILV